MPFTLPLYGVHTHGVIILGAGLTGLATAVVLEEEASGNTVLLERADRPGGLVQTDQIGRYWFDRVIHLLYFSDAETERRVRALPDLSLHSCPPRAFAETAEGAARFPIQMHLGDLSPAASRACLADLEALASAPAGLPSSFQETLQGSFGATLYALFFGPYNRKMWKRPLDSLAPTGFQWNIQRPDLDESRRGYATPDRGTAGYNAAGWYPRPPDDSGVRGMEVLTRSLAARVRNVHLRTDVRSLDLASRTVHAVQDGVRSRWRYESGCVSTLPLPAVVAACSDVPSALRRACAGLRHNRVLSAYFAVEGKRPNLGHWRYYADEDVVFNRLVFLHEFDPSLGPSEGWPLLAEITEPAEGPPPDADAVLRRVRQDLDRLGVLPDGSRIVHERLAVVDPAYVVFTPESQAVVAEARAFLRSADVWPVGRYGHWEYSSMSHAMRDGFALGRALAERLSGAATEPIRPSACPSS